MGAAGPVPTGELISIHEARPFCCSAPVLAANGQSRNTRRMDHSWRPSAWCIWGIHTARDQIGLDAASRLNAKPRELTVTYYDSNASPCACFADGIAIATYASVGQRTLLISPDKAPDGALAVIIIRPRQGGSG